MAARSSLQTALLVVATTAALLVAAPTGVQAFTNAPSRVGSPYDLLPALRRHNQQRHQSSATLPQPLFSAPSASSSSSSSTGEAEVSTTASSAKEQKIAALKRQVREEGGRFAFYTKYGALNPFAIYYGLVAIGLGIPWFLALTVYQGLAWVTRGKIDKQRLIPVWINHLWGTALMRLTRCYPKMENKDVLKKFYKR